MSYFIIESSDFIAQKLVYVKLLPLIMILFALVLPEDEGKTALTPKVVGFNRCPLPYSLTTPSSE
jgi:hypothetical protein